MAENLELVGAQRKRRPSFLIVYSVLSLIIAVLALSRLVLEAGFEYHGIALQCVTAYNTLVETLISPWASKLGAIALHILRDWWRLNVTLHLAWVHAFVLLSIIYSAQARSYFYFRSGGGKRTVSRLELAILGGITLAISLGAALTVGVLMVPSTSERGAVSLIDIHALFLILVMPFIWMTIQSLLGFALAYIYHPSPRPNFFDRLWRGAKSDVMFQMGLVSTLYCAIVFAAYFSELPFSMAYMSAPVFKVDRGGTIDEIAASIFHENRIGSLVYAFGGMAIVSVVVLTSIFRRERTSGKSISDSFEQLFRAPSYLFIVQVVVGVAAFVVLSVAQHRFGF